MFTAASLRHGGPAALYREGEQSSEWIERDRGYYFLRAQSRYANDRIPDDLTLQSDMPEQVNRESDGFTQSREFERWVALARRYKFTVYLAPRYYREHEFAAPRNSDPPLRAAPEFPRTWTRLFSTGQPLLRRSGAFEQRRRARLQPHAGRVVRGRFMAFNSVVFAGFFIAVAVLHFTLPLRFRWMLLLAASYVFYMSWSVRYVFVIATITALDYCAGARHLAKHRRYRAPRLARH